MKLRPNGPDRNGATSWLFWCPACKSPHQFLTPRWSFDGNREQPTFAPSLLLYTSPPDRPDVRHTLCHLFLANGRIQYLTDCPHALAGQTIDLPDLPAEWAT